VEKLVVALSGMTKFIRLYIDTFADGHVGGMHMIIGTIAALKIIGLGD
jgi:hypothetical protein